MITGKTFGRHRFLSELPRFDFIVLHARLLFLVIISMVWNTGVFAGEVKRFRIIHPNYEKYEQFRGYPACLHLVGTKVFFEFNRFLSHSSYQLEFQKSGVYFNWDGKVVGGDFEEQWEKSVAVITKTIQQNIKCIAAYNSDIEKFFDFQSAGNARDQISQVIDFLESTAVCGTNKDQLLKKNSSVAGVFLSWKFVDGGPVRACAISQAELTAEETAELRPAGRTQINQCPDGNLGSGPQLESIAKNAEVCAEHAVAILDSINRGKLENGDKNEPNAPLDKEGGLVEVGLTAKLVPLLSQWATYLIVVVSALLVFVWLLFNKSRSKFLLATLLKPLSRLAYPSHTVNSAAPSQKRSTQNGSRSGETDPLDQLKKDVGNLREKLDGYENNLAPELGNEGWVLEVKGDLTDLKSRLSSVESRIKEIGIYFDSTSAIERGSPQKEVENKRPVETPDSVQKNYGVSLTPQKIERVTKPETSGIVNIYNTYVASGQRDLKESFKDEKVYLCWQENSSELERNTSASVKLSTIQPDGVASDYGLIPIRSLPDGYYYILPNIKAFGLYKVEVQFGRNAPYEIRRGTVSRLVSPAIGKLDDDHVIVVSPGLIHLPK